MLIDTPPLRRVMVNKEILVVLSRIQGQYNMVKFDKQ